MSARILLIGATGIVGRDLLDALAATPGFAVTATSRNPPVVEKRAGVRWIKLDLARSFDLRDEMLAADWVVLNAASKSPGRDLAGLEELRVVNIDAVSQIAAAARDRKLLFISSLSLLRRPFGDPITEEDECAPATPYSASKFWGEQVVRQAPGHCIFRISSPVPREWRSMEGTVLRSWIEAGMAGGKIEIHGKGLREQDFVSAADIAEACVLAITKEARGTFNIASGQAVAMKTLAALIQQRFPSVLVTQDVSKDGNDGEHWRVDISKARRELGFQPRHDAARAIDRMLASGEVERSADRKEGAS